MKTHATKSEETGATKCYKMDEFETSAARVSDGLGLPSRQGTDLESLDRMELTSE